MQTLPSQPVWWQVRLHQHGLICMAGSIKTSSASWGNHNNNSRAGSSLTIYLTRVSLSACECGADEQLLGGPIWGCER